MAHQRNHLKNNFAGAEKRLRRLLEMGREHRYDHSVSFEPGIVDGEARLNLAACLIRQAKLKEATEILEDLSAHDPQLGQAARANLQAIRSLPRQSEGPSERKKRKR